MTPAALFKCRFHLHRAKFRLQKRGNDNILTTAARVGFKSGGLGEKCGLRSAKPISVYEYNLGQQHNGSKTKFQDSSRRHLSF
jgi:hypothetical protein